MSFNKFELKTRCKIKLVYTSSYNVTSFNNMIKYHDVIPTNITLKLQLVVNIFFEEVSFV
jgi:hypothetical protein